MNNNEIINEHLERFREAQFEEEERKREEIAKWKAMPAYETENRIAFLREFYKKQKLPAQAEIMLRVNIPDSYEFKFGWSCFLEVTCNGETLIKEYASADYCESIFGDKSWKESSFGSVSFHSQKLDNIIVEKKTKKKKEVSHAKPRYNGFD